MKPPCLSALTLRVSLCFLLGVSAYCPASGPLPDSSTAPQSAAVAKPAASVAVPGPLRSFLRMAGISQKISPEEVLPLLARNVAVEGYQGRKDRIGRPTEFLILLKRYVDQADELVRLAGPEGVIRVPDCEHAGPLLAILGYQLQGTCGKQVALETADPERAFLTIDSGFPLAELEETLRGTKPFVCPFASSPVPVLFSPVDWVGAARTEGGSSTNDVVRLLLEDPVLARLYWALARMDSETAAAMKQFAGVASLRPFAPVLDFYGSHISIRNGRVLVPGGASAESAWKSLAGASPDSPKEFVARLLVKDDGWFAAYFDTLSRLTPARQVYFADSHRLQHFYEALLGRDSSPGPARPVFRPDPDLLLLVTRLQFDSSGQPTVPGDLQAWQQILRQKSDSRVVRDWARRASHWKSSEELVEAMFAFSRIGSDEGPLRIYLMLNAIDNVRPVDRRLSPQTVRLLAEKFSRYGQQYLIFSEFEGLNDASIARFLEVVDRLDRISNLTLRANALGIFQSDVGLWQILARQRQISPENLNDSWQRMISPFAAGTNSAPLLFDAGRASLQELSRAVSGKTNLSQDELIKLLAGPNQPHPEGQQVRQEMANRIQSVMESQRLVSLDTLLALGQGLNEMAQGKAAANDLLPLAGQLREFEMPRPMFTSSERSEWAAGFYNSRHTSLQTRTDLAKLIKSSDAGKQLADARGLIVPFLRDTLVGLNYAYYEPPGAQVLHNNPLFVRSHDFSGEMAVGGGQSWHVPHVFGTGLPAGGGAHLAGSLADLPFVLAEAEQDFIVPENVQALIWHELVPGLVSSSTLPRWWGVSRNELHAVTLYQRTGEELLAASAQDPTLRRTLLDILSGRMVPQRLEQINKCLQAGAVDDVLSRVMPGETFFLAAEFRRRFPGQTDSWGKAGAELEHLASLHPAEVSWKRLSDDFGVPHPALAQSYSRELLNLKPFPAFMGYSSRLLAESWDSNNLYWARLADEMGYAPVMLNRLVPELTYRMVEKIFATDFEDWPAILRAMRETGEEFRQGKIASLPKIDGKYER
ncbi:MAG TPA: hypothetical protein VGZ28_06535 [Terriglobales bacterium]|nr:hypothetical protein [Terriglobales bacterium]